MAYVATVPYADRTYGDAYFTDRTNTAAWDAADDTLKDKALAEATRTMDTIAYVGDKQDADQLREFPRTTEETGVTPDEVSQACCEVAIAILAGKTLESESGAAGVASEQVGDASVSYEDGGAAQQQLQNAGLPSATAARLLSPWLVDPREIRLRRV